MTGNELRIVIACNFYWKKKNAPERGYVLVAVGVIGDREGDWWRLVRVVVVTGHDGVGGNCVNNNGNPVWTLKETDCKCLVFY